MIRRHHDSVARREDFTTFKMVETAAQYHMMQGERELVQRLPAFAARLPWYPGATDWRRAYSLARSVIRRHLA